MPIAKVQLPDGRIGRFDVPEGTTPEQVLEYASKNIAQPAPAPTPTPAPTQQPSLMSRVAQDLNVLPNFTPMGFLANKVNAGMNAPYELGGRATDLAMKTGVSPETAAKIGYAVNLAPQIALAFTGGSAAKQAGQPVMEDAARNVMQRAVKPTWADVQSGDAAKAINTMLEQGFNPTKGGVEAMQKQIGLLRDQVGQAVQNSPAMINKNAVASRLNSVLDRFSNQVTPQGDLNAIQNAWTEFLQHPDLLNTSAMSAAKAQAMKTGTYRILEGKYGEVGSAATEAQKALARGLKEELSAAIPGIAEKNAQEAALINARDIAFRAANRQGNKDLAGLALLAKDPMAGLGFLADRSALVKSLLARSLYANSGTIPTAVGALGINGPALLQNSGALYQQ